MSLSRTPKKTSRKAPSGASSAKRGGHGHLEAPRKMRHYIGIVHHDDGSAWGICFPDLPGCFSAADSFEDLPNQAQEAVALWLETAVEAGKAVPAPSDLDRVRKHEDAADAVSFLPIPAPVDDRCIRLNITLPESLVGRIDAQVGARERSGFLARAARLALK